MALDLAEALMRTEALKIAPAGEVFWYTSGTVGPYYINAHYLYGGPQRAGELLEFIDAGTGEGPRFLRALRRRVGQRCAEDPLYRAVAHRLVAHIRGELGEGFDYVSGGERRDWFFSLIVAMQMNKPHLFIYKDRATALLEGEQVVEDAALKGRKVVHVADLVTEASSYVRRWIPALRARGGRMLYALNVVDRGQGGLEKLRAAGTAAAALLRVDEELFARLVRSGRIDEGQCRMLRAYYKDPQGAMKAFLQEHPDFVRRALLSSDERRAGRARLLVEQNPYRLDQSVLLG